jgi:outer membrane protein
MTKGFRLVLAAVFLCVFTSAASADEALSLKVGYMMLSPSGELAAEVNGLGTRVSLENDLDLDDSEDMMAEAALALGDIKLTVGYLPLSFEGSSTLSRSILFDGRIYPVGSPIESSIDLDILDVGLTWFFINMDDAPTRLQVGVELAAKITDAEASLNNLQTGLAESASATVPIPTIGLRARVAFSDFIGINGRVGYLGYSDNHFMDADVQLEVSPLPFVGVFAGYRYMDIAIDESDIYVDADFSGFYGGAFVRF